MNLSPSLHLIAAGLPPDRFSSKPLIRRMERKIEEQVRANMDKAVETMREIRRMELTPGFKQYDWETPGPKDWMIDLVDMT